MHDGPHEQAGRQIARARRRRPPGSGTSRPGPTRRSGSTRRTPGRWPPAAGRRPARSQPTPRCTTSPGTRCVTSTLVGSPSRTTVTRWRISECIASAARSARYSFANPSPTDADDDHPDDRGVSALAHERRHRRRGEQQPQQRTAHLPSNTDRSAGVMGTHRIRPERLGSLRRLGGGEPTRPRPEKLEHVLGRH